MNRLVRPDIDIREFFERRYPMVRFKHVGQGSSGRSIAVCPFHNKPSKNPNLVVWGPPHNTFTCSCRQNRRGRFWVEYVEEYEGLAPLGAEGFDETIRFVNRTMGLDDVYREDAPADPLDVVHAVYRLLASSLEPVRLPAGTPHYEERQGQALYRGLDTAIWLEAGVGMLPGRAVRALSERFSEEALKTAGIPIWSRLGLDYLQQGVLFIKKSHAGAPVGFGLRRYETLARLRPGTELKPKFVKNSAYALNRQGDYLFGYHEARRARSERIYVVEGEFDQMAIALRGETSAVATGQGLPTDAQMALLKELGREIVLVTDFDTNASGQMNAVAFAEAHHAGAHHTGAAATRLRFLMMPPGEAKSDPDSFLQTYGLAAFEALELRSARQVRMLGEEMVTVETDQGAGLAWKHAEALCDKYMHELLEQPSSALPDELTYIAGLSGVPEGDLRRWLVGETNRRAVEAAERTGALIQLTPV